MAQKLPYGYRILVLISRLYLDGLQFYHRKFFVDLFWISIIVSNDYNKYTLMPKNE